MRVLWLVSAVMAGVLAWAPTARATDPQYVVPGDSAPIFTVAGGGTQAPRPGVVATAARLHPREAVALPDGRIFIRDDEYGGDGRLVAVTPDGRISSLPPLSSDSESDSTIFDIDVSQDGELLVVVDGDPSVLRLGATGWTAVPSPRYVTAIAGLPDGGMIVLKDGWAWRLSRDGVVLARRELPAGTDLIASVTPMADGSFVIASTEGDSFSVRLNWSGPSQRLRNLGRDAFGFEGLPDGSLLFAAGGPVKSLGANSGTPRAIFGASPRVGPGDGGPAKHALLTAEGVHAGPSGALLVSEPNGVPHDRPRALSGRRADGTIVADMSESSGAGAVRWIGAAPPGRLQAAISPMVYRRLPSGLIPIVTTLGGTVEVVVRTGERTVATHRAIVTPGRSHVDVGRRLPPADYTVEMSITSGSQTVVHRLGVSTRRVLPLRVGVAAIRRALANEGDGDGGGGYYTSAAACRRAYRLRVTCRYVGVDYFDDGVNYVETRRCIGSIHAYQRPEGLRIVRDRAPARRCSNSR